MPCAADNFSLGAATGQASSARAEDGDNKRESGIDLDLNVSLADKVCTKCVGVVCVDVYMHACMHVCVCVCARACVCVCEHV